MPVTSVLHSKKLDFYKILSKYYFGILVLSKIFRPLSNCSFEKYGRTRLDFKLFFMQLIVNLFYHLSYYRNKIYIYIFFD